MNYYTSRVTKIGGFIAIILIIILWNNFGPVYKSKNVDKNSEWYVNDIYMSNQYYYNNLLNEEEKKLYKELFEHLKNIDSGFELSTMNSFEKVWYALICDHPELINVSLIKWRYTNEGTEVYPTYLTTSKICLRSMERKVQKKVGKLVSKTTGKTDFEKEKMIYEYLGENNAYGHTLGSSDQSAYTVFTMSNTVCAGYGKAAQILLSNCGIDSYINIGGNHMWNTVELDDEYYYFDATCSGINYTLNDVYKNISYMGLNQNQSTSAYQLDYPEIAKEIKGEKYNYYDYMGLTLTYNSKDLSEIKKRIDECEYKILEIKFTNSTEAERGISKHLEELGLKGVNHYVGYCSGNQVLVLEKK